MRNYNATFSHVINYVSNVPYLYRYENNNYIDDFFDKGNLFISSFQNYKKYEDNELGDSTEGASFNIGIGDNGKQMGSITSVGQNEFTFCTSTILDKSLLGKFSRNNVFRIIDPLNFILEVTRSMVRVHNVLHGNCIYVGEKILKKHYPNIDVKMLQNSEGQVEIAKMMQYSHDIQGIDAYFLKKRKYQEQSEYRIIWQTDREVEGGIVINCKEAVKYCERVNNEEIS